jgi:hypothetical protein
MLLGAIADGLEIVPGVGGALRSLRGGGGGGGVGGGGLSPQGASAGSDDEEGGDERMRMLRDERASGLHARGRSPARVGGAPGERDRSASGGSAPPRANRLRLGGSGSRAPSERPPAPAPARGASMSPPAPAGGTWVEGKEPGWGELGVADVEEGGAGIEGALLASAPPPAKASTPQQLQPTHPARAAAADGWGEGGADGWEEDANV